MRSAEYIESRTLAMLKLQKYGAVLQRNIFLKILQNSQENPCACVSFLLKASDWRVKVCILLKYTPGLAFSSELCVIF